MADRCVCCGEIIPEGRQVCPTCDQKTTTIQCKMTGHLVELPCSASGCPLFGDCLSEHKRISRTPQTNADRIRAMSDEELAEFLVTANPTNCLDCAFSCGWRCQPDRQDYSDTEKCVEGKKRWLKQPAEEGH